VRISRTVLRGAGGEIPRPTHHLLQHFWGIGIVSVRQASWRVPALKGQALKGQTGLDPKFETLRNRDNCSERRFGWQQPVFSKWSSELR